MHGKLFKSIITAISLLLLLTGCSGNTAESFTATVTTTEDAGYEIGVYLKGQLVASPGIAELHSLPEFKIEMGVDTPSTGPTLQSVLELAGIKEYTNVTVVGMSKGRIATAEVTLKRAEITGDVLLDFSNRGTTKLCGKQIPESDWIIDVTEIRAE